MSSLGALDRLKLLRTMGFCPHQRCQLDNVTHSAGTSGVCPAGLCYTKVENGSPSFGACCFTDNVFKTSRLLGYHNKTQAVAKPIYRHSRIVLGQVFSAKSKNSDTSLAAFINANMVAPGVVATQCPLPSTVRDAKQMIVEQNISLWIQLSPFSDDGDYTAAAAYDDDDLPPQSATQSCGVFPIAHFSPGPSYSSPADSLGRGISNFHIDATNSSRKGYTTISYDVAAYIKYRPIPSTGAIHVDVSYDDGFGRERGGERKSHLGAVALWPKVRRRVKHVWFHAWRDFEIPPPDGIAALGELAERAADVVRGGGTVAVSCVSGRGRSGTFAAMVMGKVRRVQNASELVDVIVDLRRNRDGLVETPRQFGLITQVLGLGLDSIAQGTCSLVQCPSPPVSATTRATAPAPPSPISAATFVRVFLLGSLSTVVFALLILVFFFCHRIAH